MSLPILDPPVNKGHPQSEEARKKISEARKGMKFTEEHRQNLSISHKGKPLSEETRKKLSEIRKGRTISPEHRRKLSLYCGERASQWKGGLSFEPYCPKFTNEFKERVRAFFGYQCVECGTPQNGTRLAVHHVNFNKEACCDSSIPLFVSLCMSCHRKTQDNRPFWESHFTDMINQYYGGKCYLLKDEVVNVRL